MFRSNQFRSRVVEDTFVSRKFSWAILVQLDLAIVFPEQVFTANPR